MDLANCDIGGFNVTVFGVDKSRCESQQRYVSCERATSFTSSLDILHAVYGEHPVMSWNIWNKCYRAEVIKDTCTFIPDEHIVMAEDVFLVFLFACSSNSFKVLNLVPIIDYRLGAGISTRFSSNAEQFKKIAKTVRVIRLQRMSKLNQLTSIHSQLIQHTLIQLLKNTLYM